MGRLLVKITEDHIRFKYKDFARVKYAREKEGEDERCLRVTPSYVGPVAKVTKKYIFFNGKHIPNVESDGYVPMAACPHHNSFDWLSFCFGGMAILAVIIMCMVVSAGTYDMIISSDLHPYRLHFSDTRQEVCVDTLQKAKHCIRGWLTRDQMAHLEDFHLTSNGLVFWRDLFIMSWDPVDVREIVKHWALRADGARDNVVKTVVSADGYSLATFSPKTCAFKFVTPRGTHTWTLSSSGKCERLVLQRDNNLVAYDKYDNALWASNTENHKGRLHLALGNLAFCLVDDANPIACVKELFKFRA